MRITFNVFGPLPSLKVWRSSNFEHSWNLNHPSAQTNHSRANEGNPWKPRAICGWATYIPLSTDSCIRRPRPITSTTVALYCFVHNLGIPIYQQHTNKGANLEAQRGGKGGKWKIGFATCQLHCHSTIGHHKKLLWVRLQISSRLRKIGNRMRNQGFPILWFGWIVIFKQCN